ncbi:MAG: hypothetical protein AB7G17_14360 [Phycisphaerales bacterium]
MAALTAITATNSGTLDAPAAVAASDTIAQTMLGPNGALLSIINAGAGTDTITISDAGLTPAGNSLASGAITGLTVANGGVSKVFRITPAQVNASTGLVTVTHSQPSGVTYQLYAI